MDEIFSVFMEFLPLITAGWSVVSVVISFDFIPPFGSAKRGIFGPPDSSPSEALQLLSSALLNEKLVLDTLVSLELFVPRLTNPIFGVFLLLLLFGLEDTL
jgi:hypothetical protein